jgi:vitamin B12 transporter
MKQQHRAGKKLAVVSAGLAALAAPYGALAQDATLDTVVVTASRAQELKREVSSNITVISEQDIKASTGTSLADLMAQQGFHYTNYGSDSKGFQIRGMGNSAMSNEIENQVLILLDGRRIGNMNLTLFGLANVERVEIIRGPAAVQYGSSAMGGVINVITQKGANLEPFASLEVGFGSDSLKRQKLAFGGSANGFDFSFGGTNSSRDDLTTHYGRWYHSAVDRDQAYNIDLGYTFAKNHRIGINYNFSEIKSELQQSGIHRVVATPPSFPNRSDSPYEDHKKNTKNTALSYTGSTDSKNLDWLVNYSFGSNQSFGWDQPGKSINLDSNIDTDAFNAQLNLHSSLFSLSGGIDQYKYKTKSWSNYTFITAKSTNKDLGFYLTGKLRLLDERLIFSLGLRQDKFETSHNKFANADTKKKINHTGGSVGVSYLPIDGLKLRANYAEGFRVPSADQVSGGAWILPNHALKPEESKTWEFGTDVNWNNVNGSLTYFHSDWKDKIIVIPVGWDYQWNNLKAAEIAGIEGALSWNLGKAFKQSYGLSPYVNFTWLTTRKNKDPSQYFRYHGISKTLPNTPKWMASYGVDFSHPGWKLKSRLNANYYGEVFTGDSSGSGQLRPGDDNFKRPSGTVVNWSIDKELADFSDRYGKLSLRAEVNNLFNGKNEVYWDYPEGKRNFYVGLRYDYD